MNRKLDILLVEDDEVDVMTFKRALRDLDVKNSVVHRENGEDAMEYLKGLEKMPNLILLDLKMPRMGGLEFLEEIKKDNELRNIPTVVLTTSEEPRDRADSFNLGAAGYMVKPRDYGTFVDVVKTIRNYWTTSKLP